MSPQQAVEAYKAYLIKKLQDDYIYFKSQKFEVPNSTTQTEYIQEIINMVQTHQATNWKKKHDELGKEWAIYTKEWQQTIEMLEEESLAKDQKIRELENYKWMYEQLTK